MARKVFHVAVGVKDLESAISFYRKIFPGIEPTIGPLELGTGRLVNAAQWYSDYINFFLFEGKELHLRHGIDHIGIQFDNPAELEKIRKSLGDVDQRYFPDPYSGRNIELFQNVIDPPDEN
jgi:catechol 2,3-dioxygenase-like lactoylglutathione lyase family enzyme